MLASRILGLNLKDSGGGITIFVRLSPAPCSFLNYGKMKGPEKTPQVILTVAKLKEILDLRFATRNNPSIICLMRNCLTL